MLYTEYVWFPGSIYVTQDNASFVNAVGGRRCKRHKLQTGPVRRSLLDFSHTPAGLSISCTANIIARARKRVSGKGALIGNGDNAFAERSSKYASRIVLPFGYYKSRQGTMFRIYETVQDLTKTIKTVVKDSKIKLKINKIKLRFNN